MGYARLCPNDLALSEETEITGELVRAMHDAVQADSAPSWVVHYALPKDDPPLNTPSRLGKARYRIDIEFERVQRGARPLFRFEAKRLGERRPASIYLGKDGLGCFLSGRYPTTNCQAGMIGYVQSDDEATWASKISECMSKDRGAYRVQKLGEWRRIRIIHGLKYTYQTSHATPAITIYHVLLRFS